VVATDRSLDKVFLEGAAVAQSGQINMNTTKEVEVRYNEAYLNALTRGLPDDRRRVSLVWTRYQ